MQLVNMDVDRYGTQERSQLGPFLPGLNAICGPKGSGKTTLLAWLRQLTAESLGGRFANRDIHWSVPTTGTLQLRSRGIGCRLSNDRNGRIACDAPASEQRYWDPSDAQARDRAAQLAASALSPLQVDAFTALASASGVEDTEAALEVLALRLNLDEVAKPETLSRRQQLQDRQRAVSIELEQLADLRATHAELVSQQRRLQTELERAEQVLADSEQKRRAAAEEQRVLDQQPAAEQERQQAVATIELLTRQITELERQLQQTGGNPAAPEIGSSYRQQLHQLDVQLDRWRQTLRDLKSQRERLEHNAVDAKLDKQLGEQLLSLRAANPRSALRSLEAQILSTRERLDGLVDRYAAIEVSDETLKPGCEVRRDADGRTRIVYSTGADETLETSDSKQLPDVLRSMQRDLHEVCQQLARQEADAAAELLGHQSQQLARCEAELLRSVESLIAERAALLQKIAAEHHVSLEHLNLAFGRWCQCHEHPRLEDWLLDSSAASTSHRAPPANWQRTREELQRLTAEKKQLQQRVDDCQQKIRDAEAIRSRGLTVVAEHGRPVSAIQRELSAVARQLDDLERRERLRTELSKLQQELAQIPEASGRASRFRHAVDRHIIGLMGPLVRKQLTERGPTSNTYHWQRRYDTLDGVVVEQPSLRGECDVPPSIVRLAMRLAIVEAMASRGEPIALVIDESLDGLAVSHQPAAVAHLARVAAEGQQIIVLTSDEQVAGLIRGQQGFVTYLAAARTAGTHVDINRQLAAYANDEEADKWYQPRQPQRSPRSTPRGEFFLNDRSLIEDFPSVDPTTAARCRALGIDRVGDLLDVDPHWLADNLRLDGIRGSRVSRWQAEARLLCSVPKLRPFDARVLVGAGFRTPQQISEMHPSQLLDRVEQFLTTDRGRKILRSGNSYELSRITSWIASAKSGSNRYQRTSLVDEADGNARSPRAERSDTERGSRRRGKDGSRRERRSRSSDQSRSSQRAYATVRPREDSHHTREHEGYAPRERTATQRQAATVRLAETHDDTSETRLKFYLELASPVVDAPSIGPRMAGRLEKLGIVTVDQLLAANADTLADKLNLRRVDSATVLAWQEQARLVCRIPNLRGHDAQLLVSCDLTSPEDLASMDAESVLEQVMAVARSTEGQRILRGSKEPDLAEVQDWLAWAASCRTLNAA